MLEHEHRAVDNVVTALKRCLTEKTEERNEVHEQAAGLLQYEKSLDEEKEKIQATIDYLNSHYRKTLEVKDVAELLDPNG